MLLIEEPTKENLESLVSAGLEKLNMLLEKNGVIHQGVTCDECQKTSFTGLRFKCDECLDLDLCFECFKLKKTPEKHLATHSMIGLYKNLTYSIAVQNIELKEKLGEGCFGKTYKAVYQGKNIACKMVEVNLLELLEENSDKNPNDLKNCILSIKNEMGIYREIVSPFVIRYFLYYFFKR